MLSFRRVIRNPFSTCSSCLSNVLHLLPDHSAFQCVPDKFRAGDHNIAFNRSFLGFQVIPHRVPSFDGLMFPMIRPRTTTRGIGAIPTQCLRFLNLTHSIPPVFPDLSDNRIEKHHVPANPFSNRPRRFNVPCPPCVKITASPTNEQTEPDQVFTVFFDHNCGLPPQFVFHVIQPPQASGALRLRLRLNNPAVYTAVRQRSSVCPVAC